MHKSIKRFGTNGIIGDDKDFESTRADLERLFIQDMRENGYLPVLGLGPTFSTKRDHEKNCYEFVISVFGLYCGKKKARQFSGVDVDGRFLV